MKITFNIFLIIFSLLTFETLQASSAKKKSVQTKLDKLHILGNEKFSQNQIRAWLNLHRGDLVSESKVRERSREVLQRYSNDGFYFAQFDSVRFSYKNDSTRVDLFVYVDEGERVKVGDFRVYVEDEKLEPLRDLRTQSGGNFSSEVLQSDIKQIIRYHEESGYPYCEVSISRLEVRQGNDSGNSKIDIELQVTPGVQVLLDEIDIRGNEQTRESVVLRELPVKSGDLYDQQKIDKIAPKLRRLGYFKWVNPPRLQLLGQQSGRLIIELAEGSHNRFDGVLGYNPGTQTSKGFVTGLLDISFGNLFGTGRQVDAHWERKTEKTQDLRLRYVEPWVGGLPLNAAFSFTQLIQDTSYVERSVGLEFDFSLNDNLSLFSGISKRHVSPDSLGALQLGIPKSNSFNLSTGISFTTLDNSLNPQSGLYYISSFEWSRKKIQDEVIETPVDNSFSQKRLSLDFETYLPLFQWQVIGFSLHGRQITSDEPIIPITEQYRFGGSKTLRGYREEQFRGSRIAWSSLEYRYLLGNLSRFFIFVDAGYFFREELENDGISKERIQDFKVGYGFGLRIDTKLGLFGMDYGLGEGDGFSNGKVHIRLANEF